jgi:transposase
VFLGRLSIMVPVGRKKRRSRRVFTPEFKAEIVELCQRGDRSIPQVVADFDLVDSAVRRWVAEAGAGAGQGEEAGSWSAGVTSEERAELAALRAENRRLREDNEILKRATAFFARETR